MRSLLTALQKGMNKMPNNQSLVSDIGLNKSGIATIQLHIENWRWRWVECKPKFPKGQQHGHNGYVFVVHHASMYILPCTLFFVFSWVFGRYCTHSFNSFSILILNQTKYNHIFWYVIVKVELIFAIFFCFYTMCQDIKLFV